MYGNLVYANMPLTGIFQEQCVEPGTALLASQQLRTTIHCSPASSVELSIEVILMTC
jgi:hypothetical protein